MFSTVGGAVVFLMSYERGQAAELDVAEPTEAGVTVQDRGDHCGFGGGDEGRLGGGVGMGGCVRDSLVWKEGSPHSLPEDLRHRGHSQRGSPLGRNRQGGASQR